MPKDWFYRLTKTEFIGELEVYGLPTDGTIDELGQRLSRHVTEHPESFHAAPPAAEPTFLATESASPAAEPAPADHAPTTVGDTQARDINQIRKWGYHFDGKDPVSFLKRIEELKEGYQISGAQFLLGLPELLRVTLVPKQPTRMANMGASYRGLS